MTQLDLFSLGGGQILPPGEAERVDDCTGLEAQRASAGDPTSEDEASDESSSEEEKLELTHHERAVPSTRSLGAGPRPVPGWPAALTMPMALDYSSLSSAEIRRWAKKGTLRFRRLGPNGAKVVARADLDRLIATLFEPAPCGIEEDFDFG